MLKKNKKNPSTVYIYNHIQLHYQENYFYTFGEWDCEPSHLDFMVLDILAFILKYLQGKATWGNNARKKKNLECLQSTYQKFNCYQVFKQVSISEYFNT